MYVWHGGKDYAMLSCVASRKKVCGITRADAVVAVVVAVDREREGAGSAVAIVALFFE